MHARTERAPHVVRVGGDQREQLERPVAEQATSSTPAGAIRWTSTSGVLTPRTVAMAVYALRTASARHPLPGVRREAGRRGRDPRAVRGAGRLAGEVAGFDSA